MPTLEFAENVNQEVLRRVNREVSLRAARFANALFSGVFRAVFQVEKAYEFTEPEVFQLEYEPDRILWPRLSEYQLSHLPLAIANEEVLASRYQLFTEYDFIVVADVSQSMMVGWWPYYGGVTTEDKGLRTRKVLGDCTKLFLLKYTLASFLYAAQANEFRTEAILVGGGGLQGYDTRQESNLEEILLAHIDTHFTNLARHPHSELSRLPEALRRVAAKKRRAIILLISDFMDTFHYIGEAQPQLAFNKLLLPLAEIAERHRVVALHLVDRWELKPLVEKHVRCELKNSHYFNGETHSNNDLQTLEQASLEEHRRRAEEWSKRLAQGLARFGVKFEQIIAGEDDEKVDAKIYSLGVSTGR